MASDGPSPPPLCPCLGIAAHQPSKRHHAQSRRAPHFMTQLQVERPLLRHPKFLIVWYKGPISQFFCLGFTFLARVLLRNS